LRLKGEIYFSLRLYAVALPGLLLSAG